MEDGPSAGNELRQYGMTSRWIVRVCESDDLSSVEHRFSTLAVSREADGILVIDDPEYGAVRFHPDGSVDAEGRRILRSDYTVVGEAIML